MTIVASTTATLEQQNLDRFQASDDAYNAQDFETFGKLHKTDVTAIMSGADPTHDLATHLGVAADFFRTFPDNHLDNHPYRVRFASGDWSCAIAHWTGTMTGPMKGPDGVEIPPTGKSFDLELCTIARWEDGQVAEENIFVDVALMMKQIGLAG